MSITGRGSLNFFFSSFQHLVPQLVVFAMCRKLSQRPQVVAVPGLLKIRIRVLPWEEAGFCVHGFHRRCFLGFCGGFQGWTVIFP